MLFFTSVFATSPYLPAFLFCILTLNRTWNRIRKIKQNVELYSYLFWKLKIYRFIFARFFYSLEWFFVISFIINFRRFLSVIITNDDFSIFFFKRTQFFFDFRIDCAKFAFLIVFQIDKKRNLKITENRTKVGRSEKIEKKKKSLGGE